MTDYIIIRGQLMPKRYEGFLPCPYCGKWFKDIEKHKKKCSKKEEYENCVGYQKKLYKNL